MSIYANLTKDPDSDLDYTIDWGPWLGNDTIVLSTWTLNKPVATTHDPSLAGNTTTVWVAGGSEWFILTNTIVTANNPPRIEQRSIFFTIDQR